MELFIKNLSKKLALYPNKFKCMGLAIFITETPIKTLRILGGIFSRIYVETLKW